MKSMFREPITATVCFFDDDAIAVLAFAVALDGFIRPRGFLLIKNERLTRWAENLLEGAR